MGNICSVDLCNNKYYCSGFCRKHYEQFKYHGRIIEYEVPLGKYCCVDSCDKHSGNSTIYGKDGRLYCENHLSNYIYNGRTTVYDVPLPKVNQLPCWVDECENKAHSTYDGKVYCKKHYCQLYSTGKISKRTIYDPNSFEIDYEKGYAKMYVYDKYGNIKDSTIIDIDDVERVKKYKWSCKIEEDNRVYFTSKMNDGQVALRLNRFILNYDGKFAIDHINRDTRDNRKINLRIASKSQNAMNTGNYKHNTSGFKGVYYSSSRQRWIASIQINGKKKSNHFKTKEEAINRRKELELKYFGEYSPLWNGGKH